MILKFREVVTLVVSIHVHQGVPIKYVKKQKFTRIENELLNRMCTRFIQIQLEMSNKKITKMVFHFLKDEAKLILTVLKICLKEESRNLEEIGESADLDCYLGVTPGNKLNKKDYDKLVNRFENEVYDLENNPKYKIPELDCWK